ncbi:hypothetical protein BHE90_001273 [Fusarium euwallaceae]|uniref:Mid2 domain-containing protein n=2 Tax=Fusarium solani species complex TaxID=232080 RepID=A0A3M2SMJ0_9HYPO|nr:hypothetical protein CDV36_001881 [Fusarium kuroshium]RTE84116.1 hypothetical protein BHE90_001273 [Fusarium euwallaceae]
MSLFKLMWVWAITLVCGGSSQAFSTRTSDNSLHGTEPQLRELGLRRRRQHEDLDDLISGTLTITIAPDATCGAYNNGRNFLNCGTRPCTWESGVINRVFCHWDHIYTACLESTETCDKECSSSRKYYAECREPLSPSCGLHSLGNGIYGHYCATRDLGTSLDTLWGRGPEDLTTMVVVNRSRVSLVVDDEDPESTPTPESEPESTTENALETSPSTVTDPETTVREGTQSASATTSPSNGPHNNPNIGAIVGGVVGGLAVICLTVGFLGFMFLRRRRRPESPPSNGPTHNDQQQPYTTEAKDTPFERLRQLVSGSNHPVELQADTASPITARTQES